MSKNLAKARFPGGRIPPVLTGGLGNGVTSDLPVESLEALFDEAITYGQNV